MDKKIFHYKIPNIRLGEFDLGGVLYHANYFHIYEAAREAFLIEIGIPYTSLVEKSQHLAIVESHQNFKQAVFYGTELDTDMWVSSIGKSSFVFNYSFLSNFQTLHTAWTKHAFINNSSGGFKVQKLPDNLKAELTKYEN